MPAHDLCEPEAPCRVDPCPSYFVVTSRGPDGEELAFCGNEKLIPCHLPAGHAGGHAYPSTAKTAPSSAPRCHASISGDPCSLPSGHSGLHKTANERYFPTSADTEAEVLAKLVAIVDQIERRLDAIEHRLELLTAPAPICGILIARSGLEVPCELAIGHSGPHRSGRTARSSRGDDVAEYRIPLQ
jgi:hypothetical protein